MFDTFSSKQRQVVAAFDFDGTLTERDTLLSFFCFLTNRWTVGVEICKLLPQFLKYEWGNSSRQEIKEAIMTPFLKGRPLALVTEQALLFAQTQLPSLVPQRRWARVAWHLKEGHRCILVSANLELYLQPWSVSVGFESVIASRCAVSPSGRLTGKLEGKNCWGPEKARRLSELLGHRDSYVLYAYGDSRGDQEMLALANYPVYL